MPTTAWVATRKGLFELTRTGSAWGVARVSFLGEPVSAVLPADPSSPGRPMIAALNLGHFGVKCHASDDQGRSWREVAAPAYPEQPADAGGDVAWKLQQIWTLASSGDVIWAGTLPGGLFRSDDGARSWELNAALWNHPRRTDWVGGGYDVPGIHSILIGSGAPTGVDRRLTVAVSCGGVWRSDDAGASWQSAAAGMRADYMPPELAEDEAVQDPHRVVACASNPDRLWCQHHNGIWRSDDGARSWQEIREVPVSNFGFSVAVDPNDPGRAWFVPAVADACRVPVDGALAVLRTDDGGRSFRVLRSGLPQSHCYDLIYRHALGVGSDGLTLMFGSTTGSLWASDDGGEHWQAVSVSLPPVHSVAIA